MFASLLALGLAAHGAIHLIGVAKSAGYTSFRAPRTRVRPLRLVLWLLAALALLCAGALASRHSAIWWIPGSLGIVASQIAIATDWKDARFGTIANIVLLVPTVIAWNQARASSLTSAYRVESERILAVVPAEEIVVADDLLAVPPLVRGYLVRAGVVGRPRVHNIRARFAGEMRNGRSSAWMKIRAEEVERFGPKARLFHMVAALHGLEVQAFHRYGGAEASMEVRVASVIPMVEARGPEMFQSETVTFFNDMCLLAPATLLDASIAWETMSDRVVRGALTSDGQRVSAELTFDQAGDLVLFRSLDRLQSSDGVTFRKLPWSTPVRDYRWYGDVRLPSHGEAVWEEPEGDLAYARFDLESLEMNVGPRNAEPRTIVRTEGDVR